MRKSKLLQLMILGLCNFSLFGQSYANEEVIEPVFERVYLTPEQIFIYPEGIFYLNEAGDLLPARFVASDSTGLYIVDKSYRCPACGWTNRDNKCINRKCPLYGK